MQWKAFWNRNNEVLGFFFIWSPHIQISLFNFNLILISPIITINPKGLQAPFINMETFVHYEQVQITECTEPLCNNSVIIHTPFLFKASCSRIHKSSPTTPSHLNPFVHLERRALASPSCLHGNENVNPRGSFSPCKSWIWMNLTMQSAIWSKSWKIY